MITGIGTGNGVGLIRRFFPSTAPAFDPYSVDGLLHSWDTELDTTISGGSKCYQWLDQTGNADLSSTQTSGAQYKSSDSKFGGLPSNNLDSSHLAGACVVPLPLTVLAFAHLDFTTSFQYIWRNSGGVLNDDFYVFRRDSATASTIYAGQTENINVQPNGLNWNPETNALLVYGDGGTDVHMLEFYASPSAAEFYRDGIFVDGVSSGKSNTLGIGGSNGTITMGKMAMTVGSVFIFNRALTNDDRNNYINWANTKYSLSIPTV